MSHYLSEKEVTPINPIKHHIAEIKRFRKLAAEAGNSSIVMLCDNQLDCITLMQDDTQRLEKAIAHDLFKVKSQDIRTFLDNL